MALDATTIEWIVAGLLFFVFFVISGAGGFIAVYYTKWKMKFEVYEYVNGVFYRTRKGRCRTVQFGDGGEEIFFLKRIKKYRPAYGKRIAKNTVAWFIDPESGYWFNVSFEDLNKRLNQIGVMPVDRDMRMANSVIRKGIEVNYNKKSFLEKFGTIIAFGMLFFCIIAMGVFIWVAFDKMYAIQTLNTESIKSQLDVMTATKEVLQGLANIKGGVGPGFVNAT